MSLSRRAMSKSVRRRMSFVWMNEGRKSQIVLPDERILDILIQPKLNTKDLLDLVASHFKLKEKDYFGIYFLDETSRGNHNWLNPDKRVLEHDFPRKINILVLFFAVRNYVETIANLRDAATVELFYLNAKQAIFTDQIQCDSETVFELAAYVLQANYGDYVDDATTRDDLRKLPVIPTSALKEHPSIAYCEERVIEYYRKLATTSRGLSIVNYMSIVEALPTYGIHYYEVKDKKEIPWWLGASHKGISVYDKTDKTTPRKIFTWKLLENLYYRDKKFSIEVHDPKRIIHTLSSFNLYEDAIREPPEEFDDLSNAISDPTTQVSVSRRTFGPGNVVVHAWFGATPQLTKCVWSMAVAQHQFYLDRKHSKVNLPCLRSVNEIAAELSRSTTSLGSLGSDGISRSGSSASLPSLSTSRFDLNIPEHIDALKAQREMYQALKARREALEESLRKRTEELKLLCIKEGELTGKLPIETPLAPGEQPPQIRRRVGTAFSLSTKKDDDDQVSNIELEYELQKQITSAAHKLSQDKSVSKYVRKQRRQSFHRAQTKLKEMEKKLHDSQREAGLAELTPTTPSYDDILDSPTKSPQQQHRQHDYDREGDLDFPPMMQRSATARELSPTQSSPAQLSPTLSSPQLCGEGRSQYNKKVYSPVLANRSQSSGSNMSNQSEYENVRGYNRYDSQDSGFSSANNMYNLMTQRTSHYDSNDEIKTPTNKEPHPDTDSAFSNDRIGQSKHGSLDGSYRKSLTSQQSYGSLERNSKKRDQHPGSRPRDRQHSDSDTNIPVPDLEPSKYGSKRSSQSEYDVSTSRNSVVEVPVKHEDYHSTSVQPEHHTNSWQDTAQTEPSPIVQSPQHLRQDGKDSVYSGQCYSPRMYEGSFQSHSDVQSADQAGTASTKRTESHQHKKHPSALVTVTKLQPHQSVELVSKPFEMSDFYKYSEKIRRQRMIEQYQQQLMGGSRCSTPSQHSSDSGETSNSGPTSYRHPHFVQGSSGQGSPSQSPFRAGPPTNFPTSSRQMSPYLAHKREGYDQSSPFPSHASPKLVKEHSTHVQYTVQTATGGRIYKSVQTTTHTQYKPLTPQKCDPVRNQTATPVTSAPSTRTPSARHREVKDKRDQKKQRNIRDYRDHHRRSHVEQPVSCLDTTFSALEPMDNVADDFSEEMMAWYDDSSNVGKKPSYV
ncbi:FERM domain-containing protein 4A-like isoform X3 [Mizuhopecten yessoensis]|uniref:FERM domain-containing protein 4A n=1 Tax=Mizuhopecten yessoensis TaxID=6573 RepID=A0A210R360_MIZYE|nr:FERM domain-containing protein 4A-like isoform X3 [Mizuhopecten yessoensis]OWF55448.1 FERM domain-containing protein 4A [Mizuhopecten yessoensis]